MRSVRYYRQVMPVCKVRQMLSFLHRIFRRPATNALLLPTTRPGQPLNLDPARLSPEERAEAPGACDFSYEDALFDSQLRFYMHAEYGRIAPPPGALRKVLTRIETRRAAESRPAFSLSSGFAGLYRAVSSPALSRMAPGAVALMIVLGVLGTRATGLLNAPGVEVQRTSPATTHYSGAPAYRTAIPLNSVSNSAQLGGQVPADSEASDAYLDDPINSRAPLQYLAPRKHIAGGDLSQEPLNFVTKYGPQ